MSKIIRNYGWFKFNGLYLNILLFFLIIIYLVFIGVLFPNRMLPFILPFAIIFIMIINTIYFLGIAVEVIINKMRKITVTSIMKYDIMKKWFHISSYISLLLIILSLVFDVLFSK